MISFDINNGGILTMHQDGHDQPIEVFNSNIGTYYIAPDDFLILLNWYKYQKNNKNLRV